MELLGREQELGQLVERLRTRRLVTITGPGGIGKSTLARHAANAMAPNLALGVVHVDLTRVDYHHAVGGLLASELGFSDFESLLNTPVDQPAIIVVDNCEHVLDEVASVIMDLLDAHHAPTVLATSRSPLDVTEESILSLGPLATPGIDGLNLRAPALRLLVNRAADQGIEVDLTKWSEPACRIVERLDGVPLAIELAAAKLRSMTLDEIATDLEVRTHALARPRFRGRPQHRSVADLVNWSFNILDGPSADLLTGLSVFAGPFTLAMAAHVADPQSGQETVREKLDDLVNASLVVRVDNGDRSWFRLLYPIRAVARQRLVESGQSVEVESRHVDHIVSLAIKVIARSATGWDGTIVSDLLSLYDNMSAAVRWTLDHDETADRAQLLMAVLWGVIHQAHTPEVAELGQAVLARWPDDRSLNWADARATLATCWNLLGQPDAAIELAEATLMEVDNDSFAAASLHRVLAQSFRARLDPEAACHSFKQAAIAAEASGMNGLALELWADHAALLAELGDTAAAQTMIATTLQRASDLNAEINFAWCLAVKGNILLHHHDQQERRTTVVTSANSPALHEACATLQEAVTVSQSIGYPAGTLCGLRGLASARLRLQDSVGAAEAGLEMLAELQRHGNLTELRMVLDAAATTLEPVPQSSWRELALTASLLPITNVATPIEVAVARRASDDGNPLPVRDAIRVAQGELQSLVDGSQPNQPEVPAPLARTSVADDTADPDDTTDQDDTTCRWLHEGDVVRIDFEGKTIRLRRSKGLTDLMRLVEQPGREIPALELMGAQTNQSALPVLDVEAKRSYEYRLRELQQTIEEAEANHDRGREEQAQAEFDELVAELTRVSGLGGRDRATGGDAERARSAVTRRIRDAIKRMATEHERLGRHFDAAVETGVFCSYRPERNLGWVVVAKS